MALRNIKIKFLVLRNALLSFTLFSVLSFANGTATITVHRGEHHKFLGMGAQQAYFNSMETMSQTTLDSANKLVYGGDHANFRVCLVRTPQHHGLSMLKRAYTRGVSDLKRIQPNVILYCVTPSGVKDGSNQSDMPGFVHTMLIRLRYLIPKLSDS